MTASVSSAAAKRGPELIFDRLLACSLVLWAFLGVLATEGGTSAPRFAIVALHLSVAAQIARRSSPVLRGSMLAAVASLPGLAIGGASLRMSAPLGDWQSTAVALFLAGAGLAIASFWFLGESTAVLPAVRSVVRRGPYRYVRHPAYAGELLMITACFASRPSIPTILVLALAAPLVVLRIDAEERLLVTDATYRDYAREVRYRLVPGLF